MLTGIIGTSLFEPKNLRLGSTNFFIYDFFFIFGSFFPLCSFFFNRVSFFHFSIALIFFWRFRDSNCDPQKKKKKKKKGPKIPKKEKKKRRKKKKKKRKEKKRKERKEKKKRKKERKKPKKAKKTNGKTKKKMVFLEDEGGTRPVRLYVTVSTPADAKLLAEYVSRVNTAPFAFATFGKNGEGYTAKNLKRDLSAAKIELM